MNTVIKPISLFFMMWRSVSFTHNPTNAKGISNYDIVDKVGLSSSAMSLQGAVVQIRMTYCNFCSQRCLKTFQNRQSGKLIHVGEGTNTQQRHRQLS
jgi:hypothetical protein